MKQSQLFTKTRKESPTDEVSKNAQLLIRAGFVHKEMAGVYAYLPLGFRVLKKIETIIREEMDALGVQETWLTTLQDPELWKKSGRWSDDVVDNWFKSTLKSGSEIGIANTHEEPMAAIVAVHAQSHKDFPLATYQIQTKFRNELRAKSGITRTRELLMKDAYSFAKNEEEFRTQYEAFAAAYLKIFDRLGLGDITFRTVAAGGSFTTGLTDEFQTVSPSGEDTIYIDDEKKLAINEEVLTDENIAKYGLNKSSLRKVTSIEVGNIFPLGTKYSEAMNLFAMSESGEKVPVIMGSYGIGIGRALGTIVDVLSDEKGMVWPENVAPFSVHLVELSGGDATIKAEADKLYGELQKAGIEVLYDDRDVRAGEKFADSDLIGIPYRIVFGKKSTPDAIEVVSRKNGSSTVHSKDEILRGGYAISIS